MPTRDAERLVEGARLLAGASRRLMPWRGRPEPLKRGLIARVPPIDFSRRMRMSARLARVPCTIVTGFLGAGKTTLIRHVLANANGRRLAVIVNEFGDVGIDGEILKGCGDAACPEENIVELANGCLCCTVADDFVPALDLILAREPPVEHIVIETSGLALPKPLVQAFHWPAIKSRVTVDGVVAVVDGAALADGRVAADLDALSRAARRPTPRSTTTIRSRRCSRTRSPAPTSSCSTSATCSTRPASARRWPRSQGALPRAVQDRHRGRRQGRSRRRCSASASAPRTTSRTARRITTTSSSTTTTISTASSWRCRRSAIPRRLAQRLAARGRGA